MIRACIVAAVLTLCACAQPQQTPANAPAPAPDFSIGPGGAAGIASALPMTREAISAAARGFEVAEATDQIEGEAFTKFTLSANNAVVFEALPSADRRTLHAIVTHASEAIGPAGEHLGAAFGDAPATEVMFCMTPEQHAAYDFACAAAADGAFWRGYALPETYHGPRAPFEAIDPDAALHARLVEMQWIAR